MAQSKSIRHFGKAFQKALDLFPVSIDTDGGGQGHGRIQRDAMIIQGLQKSVITLVVGFCIGDIANEAEGFASLLDHMAGDLVYTVLVFHEDHVTVQFFRRYGICRIQKDFGDPSICQKMEKSWIVYIEHDHSVNRTAGECGRKYVGFINGGRKIYIYQVDVPGRKFLCDLMDDIHPEEGSLRTADGHGDIYRRLILRKRIQREILRKFIVELLGFGDDPAFEGVGNTFVSAEDLPYGCSGNAKGSGNFLKRYFFSCGNRSFRYTFHFSVGMEKKHMVIISCRTGEQEGTAGGLHGDGKIFTKRSICFVGRKVLQCFLQFV